MDRKALRSAVLCYAPSDAQFASELGVFLEVNCALAVSHQESDDLIDAVERGLSDVTLVLLSRDSVPKTWKRERWEPVFLQQPSTFGTTMAFLLLEECKFPELFRREEFFDLTGGKLAGQRRLKRWLLEQAQPSQNPVELPQLTPAHEVSAARLEHLLRSLADQPGIESDMSAAEALAFAHATIGDFEGVFWIDCTRRSRAGILGDVANSLGLRLSGTVDQNRIALEDLCDARRCLFIFQNIALADRELVDLGVKTSVILTSSPVVESKVSLHEVCKLFTSWPSKSSECLRALGTAHWCLQQLTQAADAEAWPAILQLGSSLVALLRHRDRLAEAHEVLGLLLHCAQRFSDFGNIHRLQWEQSWILEHWNQPAGFTVASREVSEPNQLTLFE